MTKTGGHPPTYTTRQRGKRGSPGNPYLSSHFTSQQNPPAGRTPDRPSLYLHQESGNRSVIDSFFPWNQRFPNTGKLERDQYHTSFIGHFRFFTDHRSFLQITSTCTMGSSHVKNGTGAIGGSLNLFTDTDWNRGVNGRALAEYGSYNTYTVGGLANAVINRPQRHGYIINIPTTTIPI